MTAVVNKSLIIGAVPAPWNSATVVFIPEHTTLDNLLKQSRPSTVAFSKLKLTGRAFISHFKPLSYYS